MADTLIRLRIDSVRKGICSASSCRAPLEWYRTERGHAMPMNRGATLQRVERDPTGDLIGFFSSADSHWATCPAAARFGRNRKRPHDNGGGARNL